MLSDIQKKISQSIINIFETGIPLGDYGRVSVLKGDTGHLTYGRSQTTLASGNLALLLHAYCEANGLLTSQLKPFLPAFDCRDFNLDNNLEVKTLLRSAGDDPIMKKTQDDFFDRIYWAVALKASDAIGVNKPLSVTVVYDSKIHGSYDLIRDKTNQIYGKAADISEEKWISSYISTRREWLTNHSNPLLHKTVYRMDTFSNLIEGKKWDLPLPLNIRNIIITEDLFNPGGYTPSAIVSAEDINKRVLFLTNPYMRGEDVKKLQKSLGFSDKDIDGIFGEITDREVRKFQKNQGLKVDGKVGPATWERL